MTTTYWKRLFSILNAVGLAAAGMTAQAQPAEQAAAPTAQANGKKNHVVEGELVVQFKADATDADVADASAKAGLSVKKHVQTPAMKARGHRGFKQAATKLQVEDAIEILKKHPAVEFAEPNWVYQHQATSNDPYYTYGYLWGMCGDSSSLQNAFGSQAAEAWSAGFTGTNSVVIGVIDEGVQFNHPDLAPNMWTNPFDPVDGLDNDGNGYADDAHGWNFYGYNNAVFDPAGDTHGTHVAGTIGAKGGNGLGVAGVNWDVTIISAKFLGPDGGTLVDAIEAVDYFTDLKTRHGLDVVALNNSWGGGGYSQALHDAIIRAAKAGILFIAAAGNGDAYGNGLNNDLYGNYPSNYDTRVGTSTESAAPYDAVIAVAAIDGNGSRATFSNYGAKQVDLGAPGVSIYSTYPPDQYGGMSGTSMATPHVTGAAALYASTHPEANAADIKDALLASVIPTPSLAGVTVTGGRLDLSTIVGSTPVPAPVAPTAPAAVTATAAKAQVNGNAAVTVSWSAVSGATSYTVKRATSAAGPFTTVASGVITTSHTANVAANGTTYYYVVSAENAAGASANSTAASVRPVGPAPTNLRATAVSRSQINLAWTDQASDETGFRFEYSTNGSTWSTLGTLPNTYSSVTVSGLSAGRTYYFRMRAYNSSATSGYSNTASARTWY
jgi:subtilisin family serine protease